MADANEPNESMPPIQLGTALIGAFIGSMDHVLDTLTSRGHPFILVGLAAQRWMGSAGSMTSSCDILVRNSALESIASDLANTGHWSSHNPAPPDPGEVYSSLECDADLVLERTNRKSDSEYQYLNFWSETTYHLNVDDCPVVEVPDAYPWPQILIEEKWHPAIGREDGWWHGPHLHPDSTVPNLPERARAPTAYSRTLPRGKSPSNIHSVFVPSIPAYLDALIYHKTQYNQSKPGLYLHASLQIRNLIRYLYLELPRQQLPLLIELEEYEYMEKYLKSYKRKPFFVYRKVPGTEMEP